MKATNKLGSRRSRTPEYAKSVRINISLPPGLHQRAPELLVKFALPGLSDYFQARMRKDLGIDLPT